MLDLKRFKSQSTIQTAAKTLNELMADFEGQGYILGKRDDASAPIHQSRRGKWQMFFMNKNDYNDRIWVFISDNLIASIIAKEPGVELEKSPVYIGHPMDDNNKPILDREILSVGIIGGGAKPVAKGTALFAANFAKAEPANA